MSTLDAAELGDDAAAVAPVKSSFFLGLRVLPAEQRRAMYAIYGFCRAADDIADAAAEPAPLRLERLDAWRARIALLYADAPVPPALAPLREAVRRFALQRADFEAVLDGMAMDARGAMLLPTRETLALYCDRVACAPGRLSVRVFGLGEAEGRRLAHHLGQALQLTNILRDIDEDASLGRVYLPREPLAAAGIADLPVPQMLADPRLEKVGAALAAEARDHFAAADAAMRAAPRASVRAPRLMAAAYRPLLDRLAARGWAAPRRRVPKRLRDLAWPLLLYGLI